MSWQEDLALAEELEAARARNRLLRGTIIWGPVFALVAGLFVFMFIDQLLLGGDHGGTWFFVGLLAFLGFLFGFQASQPLLDLRAGPREKTGVVAGHWSRSDFLVMRSHYIRLNTGEILHVRPDLQSAIKEGDRVRVRFYSHSAVAIWVEKLLPERPGDATAGGA